MVQKAELRNILARINGKGYKAYKEIYGSYNFDHYILSIDYVQGDPYASPSRIRIIMNQDIAQFPKKMYDKRYKKIALSDHITRVFNSNIKKYNKGMTGTAKSGHLYIDNGGQEVLERTSVIINEKKVEVRLELVLPAIGRKILAHETEKILFKHLPIIIEKSLYYHHLNKETIKEVIELSEDQQYIRKELEKRNLVSFIANDSRLPRESGVSQLPLKKSVIPFKSPKSLEIELGLPNKGKIVGMGIPKGITLIVGGGYHGKSTILNALELGVYNHLKNDGREYVMTANNSMKIRAEDGRRIEKVNISTFINNLPNGIDTTEFSTENASGSTSQSANIIEAIEVGTKVLLIDEDTSATNFMIRDHKMQKLVAKDKEPITPFIDKVRQLYEEYGVSSVIVIGGSGDYFHVADTVIMMDNYKAKDVSEQAKKIAKEDVSNNVLDKDNNAINITNRVISKRTFIKDGERTKIKVRGTKSILYEKTEIDLSHIEQLIDTSQTRCIGTIIGYIKRSGLYNKYNINELVEHIYNKIENEGLDSISDLKGHTGNLAFPRQQELISAINRFRNLKIE